jgi:hypothetical protein
VRLWLTTLVLLFTLPAPGIQDAGNKGTKRTMKDLEVITDTVADWSKNADADTVLHLSGGRQLIVRADNPHSTVWLRALSLLKQNHWPAYIEYEADTHVVRQLLMCTPREVKELRPQDSGDITVIFQLAPSYYVLRKNQPHFDSILAILTASAQKHTDVLVAVHPTTLEILSAQGPKDN